MAFGFNIMLLQEPMSRQKHTEPLGTAWVHSALCTGRNLPLITEECGEPVTGHNKKTFYLPEHLPNSHKHNFEITILLLKCQLQVIKDQKGNPDLNASFQSMPPMTPCFHKVYFTRMLMEDRLANYLTVTISIFEVIVNNQIVSHISVILFINKTNLLEKKVQMVSSKDIYSDFKAIHTA